MSDFDDGMAPATVLCSAGSRHRSAWSGGRGASDINEAMSRVRECNGPGAVDGLCMFGAGVHEMLA